MGLFKLIGIAGLITIGCYLIWYAFAAYLTKRS